MAVEKLNNMYISGSGENIYGNSSYGLIVGKIAYIPELLTASERKSATSV